MKKILVIEDEPEMRRNLLTILRLEKFEATAAPDGRAGLTIARDQLPDLILCDVMMPELDGHGVLKELRADLRTRSIPVIFLTAKSEKADLRQGMNLGADDYLCKPVARAELLAAISARLARAAEQTKATFQPDFTSTVPLQEALGLSHRVAEVLLWVAQGKTNPEVATILGISESTVKKHMIGIMAELGVETRTGATLRALEVLSNSRPARPAPGAQTA